MTKLDDDIVGPGSERPAVAVKADRLQELAESNKRLKRKIFDLYTVFEISKHLNSVLNTEALLDGIILTCIGQMGVNGAAIFIAKDHASDNLIMSKAKGLKLEPTPEMMIAEGSPVIAMFQGQHARPLSYNEIREHVGDCPETRLLRKLECEYLIPMSLQTRVRGLISVTRKISGTEFFEDDLEFLAILANQLSVAIENARLFDSEKETLEELRRTQRQLVQTEKLAALGQLSARVAHEVNNPLGIIKNYLLMTTEQLSSEPEASEYLQIVTEEVDRIAGIVRQLLSMFRPHRQELAEVDIAEIVDETILLLAIQTQKDKVDIIKQLPDDMPPVRAAGEQLKQVFLNLLMNACDFMSDGGRIVIDGNVAENTLTLTISDTGPGIPEENLSKVFEPFFTTKDGERGTGLGLSVCDSIVRAHGGHISAENISTGGARFTIELPVRSGADAN